MKQTSTNLPPCACCGAPSDCRIWKQPMCNPCAGAWMDASPHDIDPDSKLSPEERAAEWRRRTAAWVPRRRVQLARAKGLGVAR